jgi:anti-sigma regulatory factor (Ser/Thr protein kinase)
VSDRVVLEVPARSEYLLLARLAATGVGRSAGASEETIADLKLAVTEGVANAVRHAYPENAPGRVTVELRATTDRVEVVVSDTGRGLAGSGEPATGEPGGESGMGLSIIRAIAEEVELRSGPDGRGATLRFACAL